MAISRDEVLHVARLARLALTDEEVERFQQQVSRTGETMFPPLAPFFFA